MQAYIKAHELVIKEKDAELWRNGIYTMRAIASAMNSKNEYLKEPILAKVEAENRELTEEEKIEKAEQFFAQLEVMQHNFEREQRLKKIYEGQQNL